MSSPKDPTNSPAAHQHPVITERTTEFAGHLPLAGSTRGRPALLIGWDH
jgi:hypothetical protein